MSQPIYVVSLVVRNGCGQLLVVRKRGTARFMQPGGKPEPGESLRAAAVRELQEEVGLRVAETDLEHLGRFRAPAANEPGLTIETDCYQAPLTGEPIAQAEIVDLRWIRPGPHEPTEPTELAPLLTEIVLPLLARDTLADGEVVIRRAHPADAETVGRLLFDFNTEFDSPTPSAADFADRFTDLLDRDDVLVALAETGSDTVGFGFVTLRPTPYSDGPLAQLEELYVVPRQRDQGVGTRLIGWLLHRLTERGAFELHINVDECDLDTRRFYERHGFVNLEPGPRPGERYRMLCYLRELSAEG